MVLFCFTCPLRWQGDFVSWVAKKRSKEAWTAFCRRAQVQVISPKNSELAV